MPAIYTPMRLDRVQQALFEVFAEATEVDVGWSYSEVPQEGLTPSFVSLTMIVGPGPFSRMHRRGTTLQPIDSVELTIGPLVSGKRIGVVLNDFNYFVDVDDASTINGVRGMLIGQINNDVVEPVTASSTGMAGILLVSPDFLGGIISLSIYGAITSGDPVLDTDHVLVIEGTQTMLVNVQSYSKQREPRLGAWAVIQQCQAALQTKDLVEKLRRFGTGVWGYTSPVDLSNIAGAHWETRTSFDLTLAARAKWVRPVDVIETVTGTVNGDAFAAP